MTDSIGSVPALGFEFGSLGTDSGNPRITLHPLVKSAEFGQVIGEIAAIKKDRVIWIEPSQGAAPDAPYGHGTAANPCPRRTRAPALLAVVIAHFCLTSGLVAGEPEYRPGLEVEGGIGKIEVSSSGIMWVGTSLGRLYASCDWSKSWREIPTPIDQGHDPSRGYDIISQVRFFDDHRGLLSGYHGEQKNITYRTCDGGAQEGQLRNSL